MYKEEGHLFKIQNARMSSTMIYMTSKARSAGTRAWHFKWHMNYDAQAELSYSTTLQDMNQKWHCSPGTGKHTHLLGNNLVVSLVFFLFVTPSSSSIISSSKAWSLAFIGAMEMSRTARNWPQLFRCSFSKRKKFHTNLLKKYSNRKRLKSTHHSHIKPKYLFCYINSMVSQRSHIYIL